LILQLAKPAGLQKRLDFSIDIFSPNLDVSTRSPHVNRRIHQETLSAFILTSAELRMADDQRVVFSESHDAKWAPWLVGFGGSVAERHAENLKVRPASDPLSFHLCPRRDSKRLIPSFLLHHDRSCARSVKKLTLPPWTNSRDPTVSSGSVFGISYSCTLDPTRISDPRGRPSSPACILSSATHGSFHFPYAW
jgi:hypothetical protein